MSKISLASVYRDTAYAVKNNIRALICVSIIPASFAAAMSLGLYKSTLHFLGIEVSTGPSKEKLLVYMLADSAAFLIFSSMLAISYFRIFIQGTYTLPNKWGFAVTSREIIYICCSLLIMMTIGTANYFVQVFYWNSIEGFPHKQYFFYVENMDIFLAVFAKTFNSIIYALIGLLLPLIAIEGSFNPLKAWRISAGYKLSIFLALLIPTVLISLIYRYILTPSFEGINLEIETVIRAFLMPINLVIDLGILAVFYKKLSTDKTSTK